MNAMLFSLAYGIAFLCAGVMGFAIQRGGTCTVAAMNEIIDTRGCSRLLAMVEASVWVCGGLQIAQVLDLLPIMPGGFRADSLTVAGGALLGLGALINGACAFGAIARLGSGQWAYLATPVGFYAGCLGFAAWWPSPPHRALETGSPVLHASSGVAALFVVFVAWRVIRPLLPGRSAGAVAGLANRIWQPHTATTVIGITFLLMMLLAGAWSYTDVLADLARGMASGVVPRGVLGLALLGGAMLGGMTSGGLRATSVSLGQMARCFLGGAMMGWGSLLIPGGNDGLLLVGMPLLWPYAWLAFAAMCLAIGSGLLMRRLLSEPATRGDGG